MIRHHLHKDIQEKLLTLRQTAKDLTLEISKIGPVGGRLQLGDSLIELSAVDGKIEQEVDEEKREIQEEEMSLKKLGSILDNTATNLGLWMD